MRVLLVVAIASCSKSGSPPDPPRDLPAVLTADGPNRNLPACEGLQNTGSLGQPEGCRVDGVGDLDGDKIDDCWRTVYPRDNWIWRNCTGTPERIPAKLSPFNADWEGDITIEELPEAMRTPAWVHSAATLLAGSRVRCEQPRLDCPAPDTGIGRWILDASPATGDRHSHRFDTPWQSGTPRASEPEVIVIAPGHPDDDEVDRLAGDLAGYHLIVYAPKRNPPADETFREVASCPEWTIWANNLVAAAVDRKTSKWRYILVRGDRRRIEEVACHGGLVFTPSWWGTDSRTLVVVDPAAGAVRVTYGWHPESLAAGFVADWQVVGSCESCPLTLAQYRVAMQPPKGAPCTRPPGAEPLATMGLGDRCTVSGKEDVDGDRKPDCWTIEHRGDPSIGTIGWNITVRSGCEGETVAFSIDHNMLLNTVAWSDDTATTWLAKRLYGAVSAPDPAMTHVIERAQDRRHPLRWSAGPVPRPAGITAALVKNIQVLDHRIDALVIYNPDAGGASRTPPAKTGTCGAYELWTGGGGVALRDPAKDRYAWVFRETNGLADQYYSYRPYWPHATMTATCEDELALVALEGFEPQNAIVDLRTGLVRVMSRDEWAKLPAAGPERLKAIRDVMA